MSGSAIQTWLAHKQKKALLSAQFYVIGTSVVGTVASLPNFGIAFLVGKVVFLLVVPMLPYSNIGAALLAASVMVLLFVDCIRAERDDMAIIPLWLAREYFHMGPRIMRDGWNELGRARRFSRIDTAACAEVLAYLVTRATPTRREELLRVFPGLAWDSMVAQLRAIDGVILFRNVKSVSLLAPLRLELHQVLAHLPNAGIPPEEPEAVPVEEPQRFSAHDILGVSPGASAAEIKTAYRNRVKQFHPDRFATTDEQSRALAEEWTKALNAAYAELGGGHRS